MNVKIYFSLAILITLSAACNNNTTADPEFNYDKITKAGDTAKNTTQPVVPGNTIQTTSIPTATANGATANNGLNPAHGQPGHRCDIAVGAPLNSKPAANQVQQTSAPVQPTSSQTITTNKTTTAPGMNPPHGEPGHRCDIAVGAPLNSKPATQQIQPTASTTKTVTAPGMNPPHGEPGHRCDIGVGTPLSQPVKTNTASTTVNDSTKK